MARKKIAAIEELEKVEKPTVIKVPFSFPNVLLTSVNVGMRAYSGLARAGILDSDALIEQYPMITQLKIRNFGEKSMRAVTDFLVNSQVEYFEEKYHTTREDAEKRFLESIIAAN